jgi:hypothetical protein
MMTRTTKSATSGFWLGASAALYLAAAWMVAPGFYDGFSYPTPYAFACPPPQAGANTSPKSGHDVIPVVGGTNDNDVAITDDGQFAIDLPRGSFAATGKTSITVDIAPTRPCPTPTGVQLVTNTYQVSADAALRQPVVLVMIYSNLVPDPSYVFRSESPDGPWTNIGASAQSAPWTIRTSTSTFGYFAAGYPSNAISHAQSNQLLPAIVAGLIVLVLLTTVPMAVLRRRQRL